MKILPNSDKSGWVVWSQETDEYFAQLRWRNRDGKLCSQWCEATMKDGYWRKAYTTSPLIMSPNQSIKML